jgi:hypothetical protein
MTPNTMNKAPGLAGEARSAQGADEHAYERTSVRELARADGNAGMARISERAR